MSHNYLISSLKQNFLSIVCLYWFAYAADIIQVITCIDTHTKYQHFTVLIRIIIIDRYSPYFYTAVIIDFIIVRGSVDYGHF